MSQYYSQLLHVWDHSCIILQVSSSFPSVSLSMDGMSLWTDKVLGIIVLQSVNSFDSC